MTKKTTTKRKKDQSPARAVAGQSEGSRPKAARAPSAPGSTAGDRPGAGPTAGASVQEIAIRAYHLYLARGGVEGRDVEDWLQAERELREEQQRLAS